MIDTGDAGCRRIRRRTIAAVNPLARLHFFFINIPARFFVDLVLLYSHCSMRENGYFLKKRLPIDINNIDDNNENFELEIQKCKWTTKTSLFNFKFNFK